MSPTDVLEIVGGSESLTNTETYVVTTSFNAQFGYGVSGDETTPSGSGNGGFSFGTSNTSVETSNQSFSWSYYDLLLNTLPLQYCNSNDQLTTLFVVHNYDQEIYDGKILADAWSSTYTRFVY